VSVPRLYSRFYDAIQKKLGELQGWTKSALNHGLNKKMSNVTTNGGYTHKVYDRIFFNKTKAALGGRVRLMISGSAPLLPEVHKFLKVTMAAPLLEGYGQTESTGASFITFAEDPVLAHVGGPTVHLFLFSRT
jgi:long-chain acyl-CoA synthetase